jgi:hypothetical protein
MLPFGEVGEDFGDAFSMVTGPSRMLSLGWEGDFAGSAAVGGDYSESVGTG